MIAYRGMTKITEPMVLLKRIRKSLLIPKVVKEAVSEVASCIKES
jgi:hypothetical protein